MKPIQAPQIINQGIVVYAPASEGGGTKLLTLEIYFSPNNPVFSWLNCSTNQSRLWTKTLPQSPTGTLFLYEISQDLPLGFYTVVLKSNAAGVIKRGQVTIGVITPTPRLIIGLPYSIYTPIDLA